MKHKCFEPLFFLKKSKNDFPKKIELLVINGVLYVLCMCCACVVCGVCCVLCVVCCVVMIYDIHVLKNVLKHVKKHIFHSQVKFVRM